MGLGGDDFDEVRAARVALEAALAVTESEAARAAWRVHHMVIGRPVEPGDMTSSRRFLDEVIQRSGDEELIEAKQRYDQVLRAGSRATRGVATE